MSKAVSTPKSAVFQKKVAHGKFCVDLNDPYIVSDVVTGSTTRKYWWECEDGHKYKAFPSPEIEARGRRCPVCAGRETLSGFNDLATTHPELAREWHPTKNGTVSPSSIRYSVRDKYWWLGDCGHEWEAAVLNRAHGNGCYQCRGRKKAENQGFLKDSPDLFRQLFPEDNQGIDLTRIKKFSVKRLTWAGDCGHKWDATPSSRSTGHNCPYCAGHKVLQGFNDAATKYPELVGSFLEEENGITLDQVSYGSAKKYRWIEQCGHERECSVSDKKRFGCTYCSRRRILTGFNDLEEIFPEIAKEWHPEKNNEILPSEIIAGTKITYWWKCSKDSSHEWVASAESRTRSDSGCPHCWATTFVSKGEQEVFDFVESLGFNPTRNRDVLSGKELDVYVAEKQFAIEFNGVFWHSELYGKDKWYHYKKFSESRDKGIKLFTIWEDDWRTKAPLIKKMIAHQLGVSSEASIAARKTTFEKVADREEARAFMDAHHLQGFHGTSVGYGLRSKKTGKWVSMMSVSRKKKDMSIEIARFASVKSVPGGFSKLLKNIMKQNENSAFSKVISYSRNDHSWGDVYQKNGFVKVHDGAPGYFYVVNGKREHRLNYSPKRFKERDDLLFREGKTERELAKMNNLERVWDCGSALWSLDLN